MAPVMAVNDDLPIRTDKPIHSGKVRAVYWLTAADSKRLIKSRKYDVADDAELAVMVISDRISAYECIWRAEGGLAGVPGKGAALNAISNHWFQLFKEKGLADSHILEVPHPLVWVVQRAAPVMIEAIIRGYITGSMWRDYSKGSRSFCGIDIPDGLKKDSKLPELLVTPSVRACDGHSEASARSAHQLARARRSVYARRLRVQQRIRPCTRARSPTGCATHPRRLHADQGHSYWYPGRARGGRRQYLPRDHREQLRGLPL